MSSMMISSPATTIYEGNKLRGLRIGAGTFFAKQIRNLLRVTIGSNVVARRLKSTYVMFVQNVSMVGGQTARKKERKGCRKLSFTFGRPNYRMFALLRNFFSQFLADFDV
jgi:hypothetical protein